MEVIDQKILKLEEGGRACVSVREANPAPPLLTIEEVPANPELDRAFEQGDRNARWFNDHAQELEVFTRQRGKHLAVAGCELFVADSATEVLRLAWAKHPGDCAYLRYIPKEKVPRFYAY